MVLADDERDRSNGGYRDPTSSRRGSRTACRLLAEATQGEVDHGAANNCDSHESYPPRATEAILTLSTSRLLCPEPAAWQAAHSMGYVCAQFALQPVHGVEACTHCYQSNGESC